MVTFTSEMSVQEASKAVEKRFARKLQGNGVQALAFEFEDGRYEVELDDDNTWCRGSGCVWSKLAQLEVEGTLSALVGEVVV